MTGKDIEYYEPPDPPPMPTGGNVRVSFIPLPEGGEMLGMDGDQVWYGTPEGLGSVVADDITKYFVPGSFVLGASSSATIRAGVAAAEQIERTRAYGRKLGLSEADLSEVVDVWLAWFRTQPIAVSQNMIRRALLARAEGDEWKP